MIRYSLPSSLISLPEYLPNRMRSPTFTSSGNHLAIFKALALADGDHFAFLRLFFCRIGDEETALHGLAFLNPFHHDAVV